MPTPLTKVDVYNLALDHIHSPAISTIATEDAPTRLLNRQWDIVVQTLLETYPWDFAKERHQLTAEVTGPTYARWAYRYALPPDTIRVLPITYEGYRDADIIAFERIGDYIETDHASPLNLTVVVYKSEPADWSALFTQMVALTLGLKLARKFTNKRTYAGDIAVELAAATARAELMEDLGSIPEPIDAHDVLRVRGGDEFYNRRWRR